MGVKERKERAKENLRQEILDAASEMFATEGYGQVSMRKVADKIEYSPTTIYLYFKDKNDLLHQICEEAFAKLIRQLEAIKKKSKDSWDFLHKGLRAYAAFGLKNPNHYEVTFMMPIANQAGGENAYEGSMGQKAFEYLRAPVADCINEGKLKTGDLDAMTQSLWAAIHGVTALLIAHKDFPFVNRDRLIDCVINSMLDGMKA